MSEAFCMTTLLCLSIFLHMQKPNLAYLSWRLKYRAIDIMHPHNIPIFIFFSPNLTTKTTKLIAHIITNICDLWPWPIEKGDPVDSPTDSFVSKQLQENIYNSQQPYQIFLSPNLYAINETLPNSHEPIYDHYVCYQLDIPAYIAKYIIIVN